MISVFERKKHRKATTVDRSHENQGSKLDGEDAGVERERLHCFLKLSLLEQNSDTADGWKDHRKA